MNLYEHSEEYRVLAEQVDAAEDGKVRALLDEKEMEIKQMIDFLVQIRKERQALLDSVKAERDSLSRRCEKLEKRIGEIHDYLLGCLKNANIKKLETARYVITRMNNPHSVLVENEERIPDEYKVQPEPPKPRLDKQRILEKMKAGEYVPGCRLIQTERLKIV